MPDEIVSSTHNKDIAEQRFGDLSDLFARMDSDRKLFNLDTFILKDYEDHKVRNAISVTLNDPAMFAARVEAAMGGFKEQIVVTSQDKRFDTAYVEEYLRAAFAAADELLPVKDLYTFDAFTAQQTTRRGSVASRCLFKMLDGEFVPDLMPWDTRYFCKWNDNKGLAGVAYKTKRTKDQIKAQYSDAKVPDGRSIEILDILTRETEEVWIAGEKVKEQKHQFNYVPVVFRKVPAGSMLLDDGYEKYQSESILYLIRDLIPELNRLVSQIQTLNQKAIDHALEFKKPQSTITGQESPPTVDQVTAPGTVNITPSEGGYGLMPIGDLQKFTSELHQMIQERVDEAMGKRFQNMGQPKTATEILSIGQEQETLISPRIGTAGLQKQALARMIIDQTIATGEKEVKLGNETYEVGKLKGQYKIEIKYYSKDPMLDIARTSMAASSRGLRSDKDIRRNILQLEDPEGTERELRWEEAERLSPLVKLRRTIIDLIESIDKGGEDREWEILCDSQYCPMMEQAIMGTQPLTPGPEVKPSQPLVPMTAGGGNVPIF